MEKIIIVKWKIKPAELPRVLKWLPELAQKTRAEPGCLEYVIYQADADPSELFLYERYVDADALEAHKAGEHYKRIVMNEIIPCLETREVIAAKKLA